MRIDVSIIIPVYNARQYLENSYRMLTEQTFSDFEVIFVDDCSTDDSVDLIRNLCNQDSRFRYELHEKNQGCAVSRNTGIKVAKGEFFICLDADDKYSDSLIEDMYRVAKATNSDVTICNSVVKNMQTGNEKTFSQWRNIDEFLSDNESCTIDNPIEFNNITNLIDYVAWSKMLRRQFFVENNLWFYPLEYYEDIPYSFQIVFYAKKLSFVNKKLITYYKYQENAMTSWKRTKEQNIVFAFDKIFQRKNNINWNAIKKEFTIRAINNVVSICKRSSTSPEEKKIIVELLKNEYLEKWEINIDFLDEHANEDVKEFIMPLLKTGVC